MDLDPSREVTATVLPNEMIGNYRVVQQLGEGAMGVVFLAEHPVIKRRVAIKLLRPVLAADPEVVTRFFNEARAINMIAHENIVEILDFGQTATGQSYFIMELLEGEPLSRSIARGPMDPAQVALVADQMCRALGAAHEKGIIHRDLKPENVQLLTKADGSLQVKILDFGVAKILESAEGLQSSKTRTGLLMGTPLYMSPEQCKGANPVDQRADIYGLGLILFEMLAGRPPFVTDGLGELFALHMSQPAPELADLAPAVPPHMAAAVMKALAKSPDDRFQSMDELRAALLSSGDLEPSAPPPAVPVARAAPRSRRWKIPALVVSLAAVASVAYATLPASRRHAASPAPSLAQPAPKPVTFRFESDPAGAHVFDAKGNELGQTPLEVLVQRGSTVRDYVLRLADHHEISLAAVPDANRTLHVLLEGLPARAAPPDVAAKPAVRHHAKKSGLSIHDDDLARPSF